MLSLNSFIFNGISRTGVTNFFIKPSKTEFQDLIKMNYGLLITEISDLEGIINFQTGDISVTVSGFEIIDGIISNAFEYAIMNTNICELFKNVIGIDSNMYFTLPDNISSIGSPNLLIKDINITNCL